MGPLVKWTWVWHNVNKHNSTWRSLNHTKHCSFGKNCDFPVHAAKELINNNTNTLTGDDDTDQRIHTEFLSGLEIILTEEQDSGVWKHFALFFFFLQQERSATFYWLNGISTNTESIDLYLCIQLSVCGSQFTGPSHPELLALVTRERCKAVFFSSCNVRLITQNLKKNCRLLFVPFHIEKKTKKTCMQRRKKYPQKSPATIHSHSLDPHAL